MVLEADMVLLEKILMNIKDYPSWYDRCSKARLISENSDETWNYYMEVSMPFPFKNRDAVLSMFKTKMPDRIELRLSRNAEILEEKEDLVRMPVSEGYWQLKQISATRTEVVHQFKGDPAGGIPIGIVNLFLVEGPVNTFLQLKKLATTSQ